MAKNKLAVLVTSKPTSNTTHTAIKAIEGAIATNNIEVIGVFFYHDGVCCANQQMQIPSDEFQPLVHWQQLHLTHHIPLHLCITAAEKRGLTDEPSTCNIAPEFTVSGLGQLVELTSQADRVLHL